MDLLVQEFFGAYGRIEVVLETFDNAVHHYRYVRFNGSVMFVWSGSFSLETPYQAMYIYLARSSHRHLAKSEGRVKG